jgi:hypothetical protein
VQDLPVDVQDARFEPLADEGEKGLVVDSQTQHVQQPVVVDIVKVTFDVGFDYMTKTTVLQVESQVTDGVLGTDARAVAITDRQEVGFVNRLRQDRRMFPLYPASSFQP